MPEVKIESGATKPDFVNNPPHYTQGKVECIDAIQSALTHEQFTGFLTGNIIKYLWRAKHKGGAQDVAKAKWYIDKLNSLLDNGLGD